MWEFFSKLLDSDFMPHGHCYFWRPEVVWLHVVSDVLIALAYYVIPAALIYFARRRRDLRFPWMFVLFGVFILACGTTHVMEVWTLWHGTYRLAGLVKLLTALASVPTAWLLVSLLPKAIALPSMEQLQRALNTDLEHRFQERTAELRLSERRYSTIVNTVQEGIWVTDARGRITYSNPRLTEMLDCEARELAGHSLAEYFQTYLGPQDTTGTPPLVAEGDRQIPRRDGSSFWAAIRVNRFFDEKGEFQGALGTIGDISERRRQELDMRRLSGRLLQAQDEERRRIARDLHDNSAQTAAAVTMSLSLLRDLPDENARAIVAESIALAQECCNELRTLSYVLHPPLLDELGLAAVESYISGFARRTGIEVDFEMTNARRLPPDIEIALFRILQESLLNVHRHSGAKRAAIRIVVGETTATLEVEDHGHGLPAGAHSLSADGAGQLGVGIMGMRERASQLGGNLEINFSAAGTLVWVVLPF